MNFASCDRAWQGFLKLFWYYFASFQTVVVLQAWMKNQVFVCFGPTYKPLPVSDVTLSRPPSSSFWRSTTPLSVTHHPVSAISFSRNFACLLIMTYHLCYLISHTSVRHFLHHHCHHPLLLLTSTPGSKLVSSTNLFLRSSSTFPPTAPTPRTPAVLLVLLVHVGFNFGIVC